MARNKSILLAMILFTFSSIAYARIGLTKLPERIKITFDSHELSEPIGCVYIDNTFLIRLTPQQIHRGETDIDTGRFSKRLGGRVTFRIAVFIEGYAGDMLIRWTQAGNFAGVNFYTYQGAGIIEDKLQEFVFRKFKELREIRANIKREGALWKADLTTAFMLPNEELQGLYGFNPPRYRVEGLSIPPKNIRTEFPPQHDWTNKDGINWMTAVKEQSIPGKPCGSCWAFGAVGQVEAVINITTNTPNLNFDLAEQTLVSDCCRYCGDCSGGMHFWALLYMRNDGIPLEQVDPYIIENGPCDKRPSKLFKIKSYRCVTWKNYNDESAIKEALQNHPLSTSLHANYQEFRAYAGGVFNTPDTAPRWHIDHCVVFVGWNDNDEGGTKTWKIKNSWGDDWGENGYMRIIRDLDSLGAYTFDVEYEP
ncbi:MAG: C1 family peptidase [candidate division WOR-3 bacterium]|nr:C1 family peptidase [candidate division WOR-3 bacterium]